MCRGFKPQRDGDIIMLRIGSCTRRFILTVSRFIQNYLSRSQTPECRYTQPIYSIQDRRKAWFTLGSQIQTSPSQILRREKEEV